MMILNWIKSCYCNNQIKKKEINIEILEDIDNNNNENNNMIIKQQDNNNLLVPIKIKDIKTTTNSSNNKIGIQINNSDKFSCLSDADISQKSENKKSSPEPNKIKSFQTTKFGSNVVHFPKIYSHQVENEGVQNDKKIKSIRKSLMKDLF
jgi:hypothetical protein